MGVPGTGVHSQKLLVVDALRCWSGAEQMGVLENKTGVT